MSAPVPTVLVGLDVGTTRVKAVVVDPVSGTVLATAGRPTPWRCEGTGASLSPLTLGHLVRKVVAQAANDPALGGARVLGVGATGMGEAGVLCALDGTALAPIRVWHDPRGDHEQIRQQIGTRAFRSATGMPLDAQPSLAKILRLRRDVPACSAATRFYSVPEWAIRCLGGQPGSEPSLASRTGLLDLSTGQDWSGAIKLLGRDLLGPAHLAGTGAGAADGEPLPPGIAGPPLPHSLLGAVLTVAGHDHQVAALACGALADGTLLDSLGTAEALLRFTARPLNPTTIDAFAADGISVGLTVLPGHYCVLLGMLTGLAWERVTAALGAHGRQARTELADQAMPWLLSQALPQTIGPQNHRAPNPVRVSWEQDRVRIELAGEATPGLIWATAVTDLGALSGQRLESVTARLGPHRRVVATGGWLGNPAVRRAKEAQFPGLISSSLPEAGALGAAYLAGVAAQVIPPAAALAGPPWPGASAQGSARSRGPTVPAGQEFAEEEG